MYDKRQYVPQGADVSKTSAARQQDCMNKGPSKTTDGFNLKTKGEEAKLRRTLGPLMTVASKWKKKIIKTANL